MAYAPMAEMQGKALPAVKRERSQSPFSHGDGPLSHNLQCESTPGALCLHYSSHGIKSGRGSNTEMVPLRPLWEGTRQPDEARTNGGQGKAHWHEGYELRETLVALSRPPPILEWHGSPEHRAPPWKSQHGVGYPVSCLENPHPTQTITDLIGSHPTLAPNLLQYA